MEYHKFEIRIPKFSLRISPSRWLPSRGNVLFTTFMIGLLLWAQNAGAIQLSAPSASSTGTIAYQGRLASAGGTPLTQTIGMEFRLYNAATGGAPLWTEQWTGSNSVQVSDGLFNVMLGSLTPIPQSVIAANSNLFLGITVGTDDEMSPRVQLGSVPFAVQALTVPDGSITKAKLAADVSLIPPANSITTTMIADGAVTQAKLSVRLPRLLGQKTCDNCGTPTETNLPANVFIPVKGANAQDIIEVTATTQGGVIMVVMTSRSIVNPASYRWCGITVLQGSTAVRFAHLDGVSSGSTDYGCSGNYIFGDLPAGTYTFRAVGWTSVGNIQWVHQRQIAVFEY